MKKVFLVLLKTALVIGSAYGFLYILVASRSVEFVMNVSLIYDYALLSGMASLMFSNKRLEVA